MRKRLTSKYVETLRCDGYRRLEIWDLTLPAFGIRVSYSGHKSWFCTTRANGKAQRITLGKYPRMSLGEAREAARKALNNPGDVSNPVASQHTLGEIVPLFIELYAKLKNRNWKETERLLNQKFTSLFQKPIRAITRPDVIQILDGMVAKGRAGRANHAMAAIKKLMNWSLDRGYVEVNPIAGMGAPGKKVARERVLHDDEVQSLMWAAEAEGYPFGTIYLVLLYTAQRRGEVSGMRWSEIDRQRGSWTIPSHRSKNGTTHEVPLPVPVLELLDSVPRFLHSDYVFTTTGVSSVSGFGRAKERIDARIGATDWWVHDIRRTAASGMARLGIAPHVIEKVLNHKTGQISGVAAVYNRYGYETEKQDALDKWSQRLRDIAAPTIAKAGSQATQSAKFHRAS